MLELTLLASVIGIIGMLIRAALENESSKFCLFHAIAIGIFAGLFAFYNVTPTTNPPQFGFYISLTIFFLMFGWAASDVLDSIVFVIRHPTNPIKFFAWVYKVVRKSIEDEIRH
jgi:hypothetical protein